MYAYRHTYYQEIIIAVTEVFYDGDTTYCFSILCIKNRIATLFISLVTKVPVQVRVDFSYWNGSVAIYAIN